MPGFKVRSNQAYAPLLRYIKRRNVEFILQPTAIGTSPYTIFAIGVVLTGQSYSADSSRSQTWQLLRASVFSSEAITALIRRLLCRRFSSQ
jgi:hypothetical protein